MVLNKYQQWRKRVRRRWKHQPGWWPWILSLPARGVIALLRALPLRLSFGIAERVGRLMWLLPKRRRVGMDHLAQALPDLSPDERSRIGRLSCGHNARMVAEPLLLGPTLKPEDVPTLMDIEPSARELFLSSSETGAVFVGAHFGSMEASLGVIASHGHRILTVVRLPPNYYVARALTAGREGWGVDLTGRDGALKRMRSRLLENQSVSLQMDVNARRGGIFVPWFGRLAATEPAAAWLALKTGRPLIVAWSTHRPDGLSWRVGATLVRPASPPEKHSEEKLRAVTAAIHGALEEAILQCPEQYFWIHNRYRTRPPDEA